LIPDSGYQIPDHGIARAAQALAPRVALSFYIRVKILVCSLNSESLICLKRYEILKIAIRVRGEITLYFQESGCPNGKARGGRIASYLTDEQRSQAGWIGSLKCEIILSEPSNIPMPFSF